MEKLFCILSSDNVDISLRRSAAEQLSVVLQGELSVKDANIDIQTFLKKKKINCIVLIHFHAESRHAHSTTLKPTFKPASMFYGLLDKE